MARKGRTENLLKAGDLTTEQLRERGRKGGFASVKAKREKKLMRETVEMILSMAMQSGEETSVENISDFASMIGKNITVQDAIIMAQARKAVEGDTKAAEYLRDTAGQKPSDKVQLESSIDMNDKLQEVDAYIKGRRSDE